MSLKAVIRQQVIMTVGDIYGNIASPFYQFCPSGDSAYSWACDVDIGTDNVLRCVLIDAVAKNDVLRWGQIGTPVVLKKVGNDKYTIAGISPKKMGLTHIIYVDFTDYIGKVVRDEIIGRIYRPLTFEEIGLYGGGWGQCPFGSYGCWESDGTFVEIIY